MPPGMAEADQRRRAAEARGEQVPVPIWDHATGDLKRHPDGRLVMVTPNDIRGPLADPPCVTAPKGCER